MDQDNESQSIVFEEDANLSAGLRRESASPKMVQWTIKYSGGLIKNEKQANYVLLVFVALALIISFFLVSGGDQELPPKGMKL